MVLVLIVFLPAETSTCTSAYIAVWLELYYYCLGGLCTCKYYCPIENLVSGDTTVFCELYLKPLLCIGQYMYIILLIDIIPTVAFDFTLIILLSPTGVSLL